jgi:hypothetical protein
MSIPFNYILHKKIICMGEVGFNLKDDPHSWDEWIKNAESISEETRMKLEKPDSEYYYVETRIYKKEKK